MISFRVEITCNGCGKACGPGLELQEDGSTSPSIVDYLVRAQDCGWTVDRTTAIWCEHCTRVLPTWRTERAEVAVGGVR